MKSSRWATKEATFHDDLVQQGGRSENRYYTYEAMNDVLLCQDRFLGDIDSKNVLDFGCGTGWLTINLLKKGAKVFLLIFPAKVLKNS